MSIALKILKFRGNNQKIKEAILFEEILKTDDMSNAEINELLSKFDNGLELYQTNAVFANCIEHLLRGGDVYKILEQIIVIQDSQQKHFKKIISSGKIRQEIIVSKEKFDEILDNKFKK